MGSHNSRTLKHSQELYKLSLSFFWRTWTHAHTRAHTHTHTHASTTTVTSWCWSTYSKSVPCNATPNVLSLATGAFPSGLWFCLWVTKSDYQFWQHAHHSWSQFNEWDIFWKNFFMKTTQIKWSTDLEARLKAGNINLYYFQTPVTLKLGQGCLNCYMPCRLSLYSTLQTRSKTVRTLPTFLSLFKNLSSISLFWDTSVFVCWNLNLLCQHAYILRICQRLGPVHARHFKSKCSVLVLQVPIFSIISVYQDTSSTAKHQPPEKIHRQAAGRNDYRDKLWMIRWSRNYREKLWMIRWSRNYRDKLWIRWSRNYREKLWMIRWSRNYRDKLWMLRWSRNYSGHPSKHKQER